MKEARWRTFKEETPPENAEILIRKHDDPRDIIVFGRIIEGRATSHASGPEGGLMYLSFIPLPMDKWSYANQKEGK